MYHNRLSRLLLIFSFIASIFLSCGKEDAESKQIDDEETEDTEDTTAIVNLALNKNVETRVNSVDGEYSNQTTAHNITDGDTTTYWESTDSYKHSILIDLGNIESVKKIIVRWVDGRGCNAYTISFGNAKDNLFQYVSKNNVEEKYISTFTGFNEEARYVELLLRGRLGYKGGYRISEIEIYSTGDEEEKHVNTAEEQKSIDTVTQRLTDSYLSEVPDDNISSFLKSMLNNGSWSDIDYTDKTSSDGWKPMGHLNRLKIMALNYSHPESKYYHDSSLLEKIVNGLLYYKAIAPKCSDNWWYNDIGAPKVYMIPTLLIKGQISEEKMTSVSGFLRNRIESYMGGGKNLSWIAEIAMHKGCAENNYEIVRQSFDAISSTLAIVSEQGKEGLKIDGSFHQHHAQLNTGSYGKSLISDLTKYMNIASQTGFSEVFTSEKLKLFNDFMRGTLLLSYRTSIDFGSMGRGITRALSGYSTIPVSSLKEAVTADPQNSDLYNSWIDHVENSEAFPLPNVNKYFWKSDIMTQHGENFYLSAKVISKRTYGTEALNNENIKGYNLPLGATNIMTNGYEYDDIAPIWDWTRIPGTTAINNQDKTQLDGYQIGTNDFGGGVSNGKDGIISFYGEYNSLNAMKSYFFIDNMMFCLGSGISYSNNDEIRTSVEQNYANGDIVFSDGSEHNMEYGRILSDSNVKWVHHNKTGYIFAEGTPVTIQESEQQGSWYDINKLNKDEEKSGDVFSIWISHGNNPENASYAYGVIPDKTLDEFRTMVQESLGQIVANTDSVQSFHRNNKYGIVFFKNAKVKFDDEFTISSDSPAICLIEKENNSLVISIGDPLFSQSSITLSIDKKLEEASGVTVTGESSTIKFSMPTGDMTGSSITQTFKLQ